MKFPPVILIPAFNEEKSLAQVIRATRESVPGAEIVVINDGSSDRTGQIARQEGSTVLELPYNLGYGCALQTGFRYALARPFPYLVTLDGDGQHDPSYIKALIEPLTNQGLDVVIGSRFLKKSRYPAPLLRKAGSRFFSFVASALLGQRVTDPTSGFQALTRRAVEFCASDCYPVDFPDADVILMLHRAGFRIGEVPVEMHLPPGNRSMHAGLKPFYYVIKMLLSILVTLLRKKPEISL